MIKKSSCRVLSVLLLFAMLFSFAGCKKDATWIMEVDGEKVPVGLYICYVVQASEDAKSKIDDALKASASGNAASASGNAQAETTTVDYNKQKVGDVDYNKWVTDEALKNIKEHIAIEKKCDEFKLSVSDKSMENINSYWDQNSEFCEKNGISQSSYTRFLKLSFLKQELIKHYYDVGAEYGVSEKELNKELTDNYATAKVLQQYKLTVDSSSGQYAPYEDKILKNMRDTMETYAKRLEKESDYNKIEKEFKVKMADVTGTTPSNANEDSSTSESVSGNADKLEPTPNVQLISKSATDKIATDIFKNKIGKGAWVETDQVLCSYVRTDDVTKNPYYLDDLKGTLLTSLKGDDFDKLVDGFGKDLKCKVNNIAVNSYKASGIKEIKSTSANSANTAS